MLTQQMRRGLQSTHVKQPDKDVTSTTTPMTSPSEVTTERSPLSHNDTHARASCHARTHLCNAVPQVVCDRVGAAELLEVAHDALPEEVPAQGGVEHQQDGGTLQQETQLNTGPDPGNRDTRSPLRARVQGSPTSQECQLAGGRAALTCSPCACTGLNTDLRL